MLRGGKLVKVYTLVHKPRDERGRFAVPAAF